MKLEIDTNPIEHGISAYAAGWIRVGQVRIESPCIITPTSIDEHLLPADPAGLRLSHFEAMLRFDPELILLGTGGRQHFIDHEIGKVLARKGVGLEIMDTGAACRSFNILAAESRAVLAALFMI